MQAGQGWYFFMLFWLIEFPQVDPDGVKDMYNVINFSDMACKPENICYEAYQVAKTNIAPKTVVGKFLNDIPPEVNQRDYVNQLHYFAITDGAA